MDLARADQIGADAVSRLRPYCRRIEIAGSVRRRCPYPGDIEIVCIREMARLQDFHDVIESWRRVRGDARGKYTQRIHTTGEKLDIFMVDKYNWGFQFAIRTGSAGFSKNCLAAKWVQLGYHGEGGYLREGREIGAGKIIALPEEMDLFDLLKIPFVKPEFRTI